MTQAVITGAYQMSLNSLNANVSVFVFNYLYTIEIDDQRDSLINLSIDLKLNVKSLI